MPKKLLILAGDTDGNLGDLAIVAATCELIRSIDPNIQISLVTSRPDRDRDRLQIRPIRRGWRGLLPLVRAARDADLVFCGGGGLFQDDDSLIKMPYWAIRLLCLRPFSGPIVGLSIGAGPLDFAVSRFFARLALGTLRPITVRDALAQSVLGPLTAKAVDVVPDPAFLLQPATPAEADLALEGAGLPAGAAPLIGVAVRRWFHTASNIIPYKYAARLGLRRDRGAREMSEFIDCVASALDRVAGTVGAHTVFLPTYNVGHENDVRVCKAIAARMQTASSCLELDDPKLYKAVTGKLAVMLCGRMHPAILAAGQGTPVIGLAYNPKFSGMFSLLGDQHPCFSMSDCVTRDDTGEQIARCLLQAIETPGEFRPQTGHLADRTREFIKFQLLQLAPGGANPAVEQPGL